MGTGKGPAYVIDPVTVAAQALLDNQGLNPTNNQPVGVWE